MFPSERVVIISGMSFVRIGSETHVMQEHNERDLESGDAREPIIAPSAGVRK